MWKLHGGYAMTVKDQTVKDQTVKDQGQDSPKDEKHFQVLSTDQQIVIHIMPGTPDSVVGAFVRYVVDNRERLMEGDVNEGNVLVLGKIHLGLEAALRRVEKNEGHQVSADKFRIWFTDLFAEFAARYVESRDGRK